LRNVSLLNLLESNYTIGTSNLAKHYGIELPLKARRRSSHKWVELLPEAIAEGCWECRRSWRFPPILIDKSRFCEAPGFSIPFWERLPPAPSPNVPALEEQHGKCRAETVRERLTQHRANPACAGCHRPYRPAGLWRSKTTTRLAVGGTKKPASPSIIQASCPDGVKFQGPDQLKAALPREKGPVPPQSDEPDARLCPGARADAFRFLRRRRHRPAQVKG